MEHNPQKVQALGILSDGNDRPVSTAASCKVSIKALKATCVVAEM